MKKIIPLILMALILVSVIWAVFVFIPKYKDSQAASSETGSSQEHASNERRECPVRKDECFVTLNSKSDRSGELSTPPRHNLDFRRDDVRLPMTLRLKNYNGQWEIIDFPRGGARPKKHPDGVLPGNQKVEFLSPNLEEGEVLVVTVSYTRM